MFFYFLRLLEKNLNVSAPFYTSLVRPKKWVRGQNIWSSCWVIKTLRSRGISSASKTNGFRESVKREKNHFSSDELRDVAKKTFQGISRKVEKHTADEQFIDPSKSEIFREVTLMVILTRYKWSKILEYRWKCPVSFIFSKCATKFHVFDCISIAYVTLTWWQLPLISYLRTK